jgi:hypothetical protein
MLLSRASSDSRRSGLSLAPRSGLHSSIRSRARLGCSIRSRSSPCSGCSRRRGPKTIDSGVCTKALAAG